MINLWKEVVRLDLTEVAGFYREQGGAVNTKTGKRLRLSLKELIIWIQKW